MVREREREKTGEQEMRKGVSFFCVCVCLCSNSSLTPLFFSSQTLKNSRVLLACLPCVCMSTRLGFSWKFEPDIPLFFTTMIDYFFVVIYYYYYYWESMWHVQKESWPKAEIYFFFQRLLLLLELGSQEWRVEERDRSNRRRGLHDIRRMRIELKKGIYWVSFFVVFSSVCAMP